MFLWHRRAGKDLFSINLCATKSAQRVGLYWHVLPTYEQGRKVIWDGATKDGKRFLSAFPGWQNPGTPGSYVRRKRDDQMKIETITGSVYQVVGTDDVDRLVGSNPIGVVFSEWSLCNPAVWDLIRPILVENGGWAVFIYTARGKNHGYTMFKMAQSNPEWFSQRLTIEDTFDDNGKRIISDEDIQKEREAGMPEEMIQQEFYNSFEAALVGAYYKDQLSVARKEGRITHVPYEPNIPVDTFWDLGIDDAMAITFAQRVGREIRLIDYYETSGEGMQHYVNVLAGRRYVYGEHWAPHDIEVRELATGRSRREVARSLGINFRVMPRVSIADGINATRTIFSRLWFDRTRCDRLVEAVSEYRKEWDAVNKIYKDKPVHDWTSHPCDTLRGMATCYRDKASSPRAPQEFAVSDYDLYGRENNGRQQSADDGNIFQL